MPTIEFRIDVLGTDGIPHSFIFIDNGAGDKRNYGFGPKEEGSLWGPGVISDKAHEYQYSYGPIEVTPEQYNRMVEYITESINNPPYYSFLPASILDNGVTQCSQWVNAVAKAGGVDWGGFTWNPYGHAMYISLRKIFDWVKHQFTAAAPLSNASPIILDLDGDGVETTNVKGRAYFDHDGNGFAEQTGWAAPDDGILVFDRNEDGIINDGKELFGSQTILEDGTTAANGFQALADLDDNLDGKIDAGDAAWTSLKIWQDVDGDGLSAATEFHTLDELGIQSINTGYVDSTFIDAQGNEHWQVGSFTKTDGTTGTATDVWFQSDKAYTIATEWLDVPPEIAVLPDLQGYGNVYDLHQAMVRDASGVAYA
ncbi:MAG: hypothetical protein AB1422_14340 [bacterium]